MEPPTLAELIDQAEAEFALLLAQLGEMREAVRAARQQLDDLKHAESDARETVTKSHTVFKRPPSTQF
jgi:uncharacterized membrane protein